MIQKKGGLVALVTGGATGIGKATVLRLAHDGFRVVINYHTSQEEVHKLEKQLTTLGHDCIAVQADITKEDQVKQLLKKAKDTFGKLDVLVNNAGINQDQTIKDLDVADFNRILDVNIRGTLLVTKYALPLLQKSKHARITNVASANPFIGSLNRTGYTTSKAALIGLTRSLALELSPHILVNAVAPGYIDTKMFRAYQSETLQKKLHKIPLRRIGKPEEVAAVIAFLSSKDSSYITGQCFHVNGGVFLG